MRRVTCGLTLCGLALLAAPAQAQPGRDFGPRDGGPSPRGAEFFLARTGELRLTDAQVIRLATIARRSADRRRAMRASMDSTASARRGVRGDSVDRAARMRDMERFRARFDRDRDLARADLRDALAVLTADQQAMAWEMVAGGGGSRARGARGERPRREGGRRSPGAPRERARPPGGQIGSRRPPQ